MRNAQKTAVADVAVDAFAERMCNRKGWTEDEPAMLHDFAGPDEQRADRANVGLRQSAQHFFKPAVIKRRDVVVEKAESVAPCCFGGDIVQPGKIKFTGHMQHRRPFVLYFGKIANCVRIRGIVIDDQNVSLCFRNRRFDRLDALLQQVMMIARGNDDCRRDRIVTPCDMHCWQDAGRLQRLPKPLVPKFYRTQATSRPRPANE